MKRLTLDEFRIQNQFKKLKLKTRVYNRIVKLFSNGETFDCWYLSPNSNNYNEVGRWDLILIELACEGKIIETDSPRVYKLKLPIDKI